MDLEGIMCQAKKDGYYKISLTCGSGGWSVEPKLIKTEIRFAVTRGERWGLGELNEGGQKVNNFNCKINEHWEYSMQRDDCG